MQYKIIKIKIEGETLSILNYQMFSLKDTPDNMLLTVVTNFGLVYTAYVTIYYNSDEEVKFDANNLTKWKLKDWLETQ